MTIRTTILALTALAPSWTAGATLTTTGEREPEPTWYISHLGAEPCVPVTDIGAQFERVYYGAGPFRTPDDLRAAWQRDLSRYPGAMIGAWRPDLQPGVRAFEVTFGNLDVWMMFFADAAECRGAMASVQK